MGREVRRVPKDWQHPVDSEGSYIPLYPGDYFEDDLADFEAGELAERPSGTDYMPHWPESECTHWQMYEDTSEGTPISPPMESPEALARWLVDNNASAFGSMTATYDQWLSTITRGHAVSAAITSRGLISGVEAMADTPPAKE